MSARTDAGQRRDGPPPRAEAAIWQEVEWGHYRADLALWEALAPPAARVLELGCGSGRVALHLAERGREVWALDQDPDLLADLRDRAAQMDIALRFKLGDATAFAFEERFDVILAPLQLANMLAARGRAGLLRSAMAHLAPEGVLAISVVARDDVRSVLGATLGSRPARLTVGDGEPGFPPAEPDRAASEALPDVRELDGWVYSSRPLAAELDGAVLAVARLREVVSPTGTLRERVHEDRFRLVEPELIEREAATAGLLARERRRIPATGNDAGATVVVFEAASDADQPRDGAR